MALLSSLWLKTWLRSWSKKRGPAPIRKRRLQFDCLEDRVLPSVTITADTSNLLANATSIVVNGSGFDPIVANNSITFTDGAAGTITQATATSLTVEFSTGPTTAGELDATVTSDSASSAATQVATVQPVITSSAANLAADAATITLNGYGFDPASSGSNNAVTFNGTAVGTVTAATPTSLTVTFSVAPTAGSLTASVTTDSVASGTVQVATVTPVVTSSTASLDANATSLTIAGSGFDTTAGNNTVSFNDGAAGHVTTATATQLTVAIDTDPTTAGSLTAVVTTDNASSGTAVQVATVTPVVTSSTANLAANASTVTINGHGFDPTARNNTVAFSGTAAGTVTAATATSLTVTFTTPPTAGNLLATVTTDSQSSAQEQVATVTPVVTSSTASLPFNTATLTIAGFGFDTTAGNNTVSFNDGAVGHVSAATATSLTVTFDTEPTGVGSLTAQVTTDGASNSGQVQVATVTPVVTSSASDLAANATTITIAGAGFDTTAGNNTLLFNDGAVGHVTSATATALSVSFDTEPATAGNLTVVVTTDGVSSGVPVQVATVQPVVTANTASLPFNTATVTIAGVGFDTVAGNNTIAFNDGATGHVTAATATSLTVAFDTEPAAVGNLTAAVTTDGVASSTVQVATVTPVVTSSTASLPFGSSSLTIDGAGFDTTTPATNDTISFNDGAVGHVTAATATSLTVAFDTAPTAVGNLTATVTVDNVAGSSVQVATVTPVVLTNTGNILTASSTSVTIIGQGFDTTTPATNDTVSFNDGAAGTVTGATATSLTVTFSTKPATAGNFFAVVSTDGVSSGAGIQVATVRPVLTSSAASLAANADTLTINGYGFDPISTHNTVAFNDGGAGTVTGASPTSLTVTFSTKPVTAGNLTAVVTTNGVGSGAPVQVATVTPVVTSSTGALAANAATLTINGFGFDTTASSNAIAFNDGAIGTVTSATATALTVTFSTAPATAGTLNATVTTDGVSGTATQVAAVTPVVLSNTGYQLAANAATVTINGFGFDTTAGHNTVVFNNGAAGTVSGATANSLTVTFTTPPTAGDLTAVVTTNSQSSGSAVQVATVMPVVTSSAANLAANAATLTISGFGFDTTPGNNTVVLNDGASGTVTASTATSLTVTFGANADPTTAGNLTAVVTTNSENSGTAVQVATVIPVVTNNTANLAVDASTITIDGFGFDTTAANNSITFNDGAAGHVTAATATSLTVAIDTAPTTAGSLTAAVSTDGVSSGSQVQVATVIPVVASSVANLTFNPSTLTINGFGFATTATDNSVTFNDGATGHVSAATATSLTVTFDTEPATAGNLTATVTTNGASSGTPVQVATVTPVVTSSAANLAFGAGTVTINGLGFDTTAGNNTVTFNDGAVGTVSTATATSLTVTFSTNPTGVGNLTAVVSTDGASSGTPVQVATVTPVVTSSTANLGFNPATITIAGLGFDSAAGNNTVVFNDGAAGSVTAATATSLTVTFFTEPATAGNLTAVVTTNGVSSGTPVQVATITPFVSSSSANLAANAGTITINGFGFDTTAGNDQVTFSNGAVGNITGATANQLTVTFTTPPTAGNLTAVVTTDGASSGTPVQVATVIPVVTSSSADLAFNPDTLIIDGFGFDTTAGNNTVAFNDGATGNVTTATATQLTVTFATEPSAVGNLTAVITTDNASSGTPVQVATVIPVVTGSTANLAANAATMTISGLGFDTTAGNNLVSFNNGAAGTVTTATATQLTVTFSTAPTGGSLTAAVTVDGVSSGTPVQVATVTPVVTSSTASLAANASTITIDGFGFDTTATNNQVVFSSGAVGNVSSASATQLTVTFTTAPTAGSLTATVTTNSESSGAVQVATVTPVVTTSSAGLGFNPATLVINGFGFDPSGTNAVTFNDGAAGTVVATSTSLTVTFTTEPTAVGNLTASVTTDSESSGTAVQVATVIPVVTSSTANLAANATSLTINGLGFDASGTNTVTFSDGAVGHVSTATATSLTVTLDTDPTTAGSLTAAVTTDGVSSGTAVQVATVTPVVTVSSANLAANTGTLTINGFGFDPTAGNNAVTFNDGAVGTVNTATATSLTVSFSTMPATAGSLTAAVTTDSVSSGTPAQVATITPVVTSSTAKFALNGTSLLISGFGFDPTAGHNTVVLNDSAVGTVTAATPTSLIVTLSTKPSATGSLTAAVTTDTQNSGAAVQVANVASAITAPTATSNFGTLPANATTLTINGHGFDTTAANDRVAFNDGAAGTVTTATATSLTVTFVTGPATAGNLTAAVIPDGVSSSTVEVARVAPVVTSSTASLAANVTTLTINGFGFDPTASHNSVSFNDGAIGSVTAATATSLTVRFSTKPATAGSLTAVVTTDIVSSGAAVQVATVTPVVTQSTASLAVNATSVVIHGFGFDRTAAHNTVLFNNGAAGTVSAATTTSLTVTFSTKPAAVGSLTAVVTTDGVSSGTAVQVATVTPVVTKSTASLAANATTLTISGFGFDTTAGNNTVVFNDGAVGTVTAATATSLTVAFSTGPAVAGTLTAVVTTNGVSSGAALQVATVKPTVTQNTTSLAANATTVTISGFGFDTTAARNTVVFNDGTVGAVTAATATSLTVRFITRPATAGNLTAIVTTDGVSSAAAVQVATVTPVVTQSTASLAANAATVIINGLGFDRVAGHNTVLFNDGAVGTVTSATTTSLIVTFATKPAGAGSLTAVVTTDTVGSGTAVQVATVA